MSKKIMDRYFVMDSDLNCICILGRFWFDFSASVKCTGLRKSYIIMYIQISNKLIHKLYNFFKKLFFDIIEFCNIIIMYSLKILIHF